MGFLAWYYSQCPTGPSSKDSFSNSGLKDFCKTIDWENSDHQRIVAAILVNAVYLLEKERESTMYRQCMACLTGRHKYYARRWWEAVGFKKIEEIFEDATNSGSGPSFGAIFKFSPSSKASSKWKSTASAPAFVLAFRGTTNLWDAILDVDVAFDTANSLERLSIANQRVKKFFTGDEYKSTLPPKPEPSDQPPRVWVAGHSLGGSLAISAAMEMIDSKLVPLDQFRTFLFNPPFVSSVVGKHDPDSLFSKAFQKLENTIGDLLQKLLPVSKKDTRESLYEWLPDIYVNPGDFISMGFIPYFREGYNNRNIQSGGMYFRASDGSDVGIPLNWTSGRSLHLLPSGRLHVNNGGRGIAKGAGEMERAMQDPNRDSWLPGFIEAHLLRQWWDVKLQLEHDQPYYVRNALRSSSE